MDFYDVEDYLSNIDLYSSNSITKNIIDDLNVYLVRLEGSGTYLNQSKNNYLECEIAKLYLVKQIEFFESNEIDKLLLKVLYLNKKIYLNKIELLISSISFVEIINNMYILIKNVANKNIFKQYINQIDSDIVYLKEAKSYHVTTILNTKVKLSAKRYSEGAKKIIKNYNRVIDETNQTKLFPFEANGSNLKDRSFNLIDLRSLFFDRDYFPTSNDIKEYLEKMLVHDIDNYLIMPLFLKGSSPFFNNRNHGYFEVFYDNIDFFSRLLNVFNIISKNYNIKIIVPSIMKYDCYLKWQCMIKSIIEDKRVLVGILVDDFDLVQDVINKGRVGCLLIDFDYINSNNFQLNSINKDNFIDKYLVRLREIRDESNIKKKNLIIKSKTLSSKEVIEKLVITGYKRFVLNVNNF